MAVCPYCWQNEGDQSLRLTAGPCTHVRTYSGLSYHDEHTLFSRNKLPLHIMFIAPRCVLEINKRGGKKNKQQTDGKE